MAGLQRDPGYGGAETSLVSGAAGFLGSHLVEKLIDKGHRVVGIDNLCTGSLENLESAFTQKDHFFFFRGDITAWPELPDWKYDYVWHLASPASPVEYRRLSLETMLVNSAGTKNMLDIAFKHRARFLLASTSETYGDPLVYPQPETYWGNVNPVGERACYDESKRFAESLTLEYHRRYGLDTRIIRIFNTYGPRMGVEDGRVVPNFICQALRGQPLTVYGNGAQTRSFVFVNDEVEGIARSMFYENTCGEVFNIGNPDERTILEFATTVARLCGTKLKLVNKPLPPDDPARRCPDISKAKSVLQWEPVMDLEQGLVQTIDYFAQKMKICFPTEHKVRMSKR